LLIFKSKLFEIMDLGVTANKELVGNLIIYIAHHCKPLYQTKLLKLLYLIDEESVKEKGTPITWLDYNVWEKGPVSKEIYISKFENLNQFDKFFRYRQTGRRSFLIEPIKNVDLDEFSKSDIRIINKVLNQYGSKTSDELINYTHNNKSLWYKAKKENNIKFSDENKTSNIIIDFDDLIDNDIKRVAYYTSRENLLSQVL
jgi:uncharacterized phage-associated protein